MSFRSEYNVLIDIIDSERTGLVSFVRPKSFNIESFDGAAIVAEFNNVIWIRVILSIDNHVYQRFLLRFTIHYHISLEKPVATMLAV